MSKRNLCAALIVCAITLLYLRLACLQHHMSARQLYGAVSASKRVYSTARSRAGRQQTGQDEATYQQLLKNTMALCGILAPTAGEVTFTAEPREISAPGGVRLRTWYVMCEDPKGDEVAHFIWDAETRELLWLGGCLNQPHDGLSARTSAESVRTARWWLAALDVGHSATEWQLVGAPKAAGVAWTVSLRSPEKEAILTVDRKSGSLNYLQCRHARSPSRQAGATGPVR